MSHILIVEDEPVIRGALRKLLERHDHSVAGAGSCEQAREQSLDDFDLIISDLRLPGEPGTSLIGAAATPVLIMTSYASLRSAVDAMRQGAVDYIAKPFDHDEMVMAVDRVLQERTLSRRSEALRADVERSYPVREIVAESGLMQQLMRQVEKVANTVTPVLISGEPGTGKELLARAVHQASRRGDGPFVAVNCGAIPENLLESELFGHRKGAFTGATSDHEGLFRAAHGGSLFLDEIGDMPLSLQSRLLRVLAEGEYYRLGGHDLVRADVRIVTATHRDLPALVESGQFRADLYHRLKVITLRVPPLRERLEDVPALVRHFLREAGEEFRLPPKLADRALLEHLATLEWPGNVRELRHLCQSLAALAPAPVIGIDDLPPELHPDHQTGAARQRGWDELVSEELRQRLSRDEPDVYDPLKARFEQQIARVAVDFCDGNQSEAARRLGMSRNTLARILKEPTAMTASFD